MLVKIYKRFCISSQQLKISITNVTSIEEDTNDDDNGNSNDNYVSIQINPDINDLSPETTFEPVTERTSEIESTYNKKRQKKTEAFIEILNKRSEERNRLFKELTKTEEDPIDLFFKSMAHTYRQKNLKLSEQTSGPSDYIFPENLTSRPQELYSINYSSTTHNTSVDDLNSEPNWAGRPFQNY
ncbi:Transcription factor Adf-1 [Aphis craccivora]|uniref:Transcription factor Adf-1 n=1 Tax=Aphis craccivora TaxID=307492 RepID=A0A6G0Y1D0_APHCR|nr:Transcription factor Adf-1 [Aphis craccivora]